MEEQQQPNKEEVEKKLEEYRKDENMIVIEADDEDDVPIVVEKFTEEDWEKLDDYIDSHPLFMNDIKPEDAENNEYISALQSIKYDESAEKIMNNLYVS